MASGIVCLLATLAVALDAPAQKPRPLAPAAAQAQRESQPAATTPVSTSRPLLLFEIDEGFTNSLVSARRNDFASLDACLEHIYQGLAPLAARYEVAVLIYPTYLYDRAGWGTPRHTPEQRFHPALRQVLDFFRARRARTPISVFLEAYSSGAASQQSGQAGRLPPPTLHGGADEPGRLGLTADLSALGALREEYPDVFAGLRFHEVYGSDMVWKSVRTEPQRGFPLDAELVRGCVELCRRTGMRLLWSDSCWLMKSPPTTGEPAFVYNEAHPPYFMAEPYRSLQDEAERQLGSRLCFSWANNNYHPAQNLEYLDAQVVPSRPGVARPLPDWLYWRTPFTHFPFKDRTQARWGMSIQSWFWFELLNTLQGRYVLLGEMDCPDEVLGAYVLKGLREGAAILQFEPSWYFFNEQAPYRRTRPTLCSSEPPYAGRPALSRLTQILLGPDEPGAPPSSLEALCDRDQQWLLENDAARPPKTYAESSLLLATLPTPASEPPAVVCFDCTSSGASWRQRTVERVPAQMLSGMDQICRVDFAGGGADGIAAVSKDGRLTIMADYGAVQEAETLAGQKTEGPVIALCAANLDQEIVGRDDPDEIVVARQIPGQSTVALRVYGRQAHSPVNCRYAEIDRPAAGTRTLSLGGLDKFLGIVGLRTNACRFLDGRRPLDELVVLCARADGHVTASVAGTNSPACPLPGLSASASGLAFTTLDADLDGHDELCAVWREGLRWMAQVYRWEPGNAQAVGPARAVAPATEGQTIRPFALARRVLLNARPNKESSLSSSK
jgi:hypothetical protein